jgi:site-specific recombinase XerD
MKGCRPLNDDEINTCLNSFEGKYKLRNQAMFILGMNTGYRVNELLSLKIKDVMPYSNISDYVTVQRANMKQKIEGRTIILNETAKQYLKNYLDKFEEIYGKVIDKDYYLFKSQKSDNKPISTRQATGVLYLVYRGNEMTGKLATHTMRKTYAKNVHEKLGNDIILTQKAMGHKQITSTQHYLSFDNKVIDQAICDLNIGSHRNRV